MNKALFALSLGTFALGIAEFVMMGILVNIADSFGISVSQAGHFISAYASGVCVGALACWATAPIPASAPSWRDASHAPDAKCRPWRS